MERIVLIEFQNDAPYLNANFAVYDSVFLIDLKCESALLGIFNKVKCTNIGTLLQLVLSIP